MDRRPSLRSLARELGVTVQAVSLAVKAGRLSAGIQFDARGRATVTDPTAAAAEWRDAHAAVPPAVRALDSDATATYPELRRRREAQLLRLARVDAEEAEIALLEKQGRLVPLVEIRTEVARRYVVVRTHLLGLASKVRQRLPHIAAADVRTIDDLVREALTELAVGQLVGASENPKSKEMQNAPQRPPDDPQP